MGWGGVQHPRRSESGDSDGSTRWGPLAVEAQGQFYDEYEDFCSEYTAGEEMTIRNTMSFNSEDGGESCFGDGFGDGGAVMS